MKVGYNGLMDTEDFSFMYYHHLQVKPAIAENCGFFFLNKKIKINWGTPKQMKYARNWDYVENTKGKVSVTDIICC